MSLRVTKQLYDTPGFDLGAAIREHFAKEEGDGWDFLFIAPMSVAPVTTSNGDDDE